MKVPDEGVAAALKRIAGEVLKEYDGLIKAIWIYGSAVRKGEFKPTSDIDMMILLDDITQKVNGAKLAEVDDAASEVAKAIKKEMNVNIHVQPPKRLSDWWDLLRGGEPWVFTSMRDAIPIYDPSGYIEPLQRLLRGGQLHGTWERAQMLLERAPYRLESAKKIFMEEITADLLLAMVESGQAVLMFSGAAPATAPTMGVELKRHFVKEKLLEGGYVDMYDDFYELTKKIEHGEMTKISGREIDRWIKRTKGFLIRMQDLFDKLEVSKKKEMIEEAHKESMDAARAALAKVGKSAETDKEVMKFVEEFLIKPGLVDKGYLDVLKKIFSLNDALEKGKLEGIPEKDIYNSRMYSKNLRAVLEGVHNTKASSAGQGKNSPHKAAGV
jgi:predicted nucleotidyltransferase/uncharacterized protein (UPF0332 family)